ncbi:MAG: hypothetical protein IJG09_05555 [Methanobrevibacter sp.]|nr:hypothetical protein [Methanobrevibacter sp.]
MDSLIFDEEWVLFVNGENKLHIGFSSPLFLDEDGVRFGYMGNQQIQVSNVLNSPHNSFSNFDSLVFSGTGESVEYSSDFMNIVNLPSKEKVRTIFSVGNNCFVKDEWMNFENNDHPCGIDFVQSYAVTDCLVNPSMVEYLLNFSDNMISNAQDTGFASFLTALSCFWMFDESASQLGDVFNVSVNRENCAVVMSGVDCDSNAYVHVLDPVLGLDFSGDNVNDTYFCRALSSLLLGDIESRSLGLSGRLSNSSLNVIFSEILNGGNFTLLYENGTIIVQLTDNDNCSFVFDIDSGLVYDLSYYDNFTYKGAISTETTELCPYIFLYSMVGGLYDALRYKGELPNNDFDFELSDAYLRGLAEVGASLALSSSAIILKSTIPLLPLAFTGFGTVPIAVTIAVGVVLIGVGYELNYYAKNGDDDEARKSTVESFLTSLI